MAEESVVLQGLLMLREIGFFDFLMPFILFFAIIYGALEKTKVFGEGRRDINSVIALVIALVATTTAMVTKALAGFLPWVGFIAIVVVSFLMVVALMIGDVSELAKIKYFKEGVVVVVAIIMLVIVVFALGLDKIIASSGAGSGISETDIALIVIIVVGLIAFAIFMKSDGGVPPGRTP